MNTSLLSFTLISIVICASPGPSVFFVLSSGLSGDKKNGLTAVFSLVFANIIWVTLSATGIAALIHNSVVAFEVLRFAGALYLVYLGIQLWRNGLKSNSNRSEVATNLAVFFRGLATSLSNPKALIFYISFLPQFINNNSPFTKQILTLGSINILVVLFVMLFYAFLGNYVISLLKNKLVMKLFGRTIAVAFVSAGLSLLKLKRASSPF